MPWYHGTRYNDCWGLVLGLWYHGIVETFFATEEMQKIKIFHVLPSGLSLLVALLLVQSAFTMILHVQLN